MCMRNIVVLLQLLYQSVLAHNNQKYQYRYFIVLANLDISSHPSNFKSILISRDVEKEIMVFHHRQLHLLEKLEDFYPFEMKNN